MGPIAEIIAHHINNEVFSANGKKKILRI